jgi:hypothetical protein
VRYVEEAPSAVQRGEAVPRGARGKRAGQRCLELAPDAYGGRALEMIMQAGDYTYCLRHCGRKFAAQGGGDESIYHALDLTVTFVVAALGARAAAKDTQ